MATKRLPCANRTNSKPSYIAIADDTFTASTKVTKVMEGSVAWGFEQIASGPTGTLVRIKLKGKAKAKDVRDTGSITVTVTSPAGDYPVEVAYVDD
jgi:hypothetical protein